MYFATPLVLNSLDKEVPSNDLRENFGECQRVARVPVAVEMLPKTLAA